MTKLIECVPNFSEGRDRKVIDAITAEIEGTEGALLLDVDPGRATNRTVVTFVGPPGAVEEAAFRAISRAAELIDMSAHRGEHPRMGATDVCPFVPVMGATMEECAEIARRLGRRVGEELGIPVYLYEAAAARPERRSLAEIRRGEYEALSRKLADPAWTPDFGPAAFNARSGATVIGAREFLIAYNINLDTRDKRAANRLAQELREAGKPLRDENGKLVKDAGGQTVRTPGRFKECRAVGWYIPEYGRAQISINLTDYKVTSIHAVFDAAGEEAARQGLRVTGSELVGLVPLQAILAAGDHYLRRQGKTTGIPERERIHAAVLSLGLAELAPFETDQKIIEYRYREGTAGLGSRPLQTLADELSTDSPAPGGGSAAAVCGALAAALASMVAALAWPKADPDTQRPAVLGLGERGQALKDWFLEAADRDSAAFNAVLVARRLPRGSTAEGEARNRAIAAANLHATEVPLEVLERAVEALELALQAVRSAQPSSVSDAGVAGACALACAEGAALNVASNLPSVEGGVAAELAARRDRAIESARRLAQETARAVAERMDRA
jgi:glutamate formiminotransferase/formiminotetrahydrofolate cyclodeaminase